MQLDEHPQTSVQNTASCALLIGIIKLLITYLWEGALDEEEIQRMSLGFGMRDGDLMAWRSMTSGVIRDAHVHYDTSACRDVTGR